MKKGAAKGLQGWRGMCPCCANCAHNNNPSGVWYKQNTKAIRCTLGDFPTSPMAWCEKHEWRQFHAAEKPAGHRTPRSEEVINE